MPSTSLADVAERYKYTCPHVDDEDEIAITDGRHPVVERMPLSHGFVPNDICLDARRNRLLIITGPNMAGKSTYIRQVALIVLMAQMGSFVPAAQATIGVVDRIFTRIGAADSLAKGAEHLYGGNERGGQYPAACHLPQPDHPG